MKPWKALSCPISGILHITRRTATAFIAMKLIILFYLDRPRLTFGMIITITIIFGLWMSPPSRGGARKQGQGSGKVPLAANALIIVIIIITAKTLIAENLTYKILSVWEIERLI